ncbi:MAG: multidrug efflux SMR transporter [Xanthobacteraceae bacterium]|jgi:small multidrug resistance pump
MHGIVARLCDGYRTAPTKADNKGSIMNAWGLLAVSIVAEVTATTLLTKSEGFDKPIYGLLSLAIFAGCFWALSQVLTRIPVGVTYAIWSGAGVVLISLIGAMFLRQSLSVIQMLFIALIVVGAVGLNLTTKIAH